MEPAISCCFSYSQVTNQRHLLFSDKMSEIVTNKIRFFSDVISAPSEDEAASVGAKSDSDDSSSDE